MLLYSYHAFDRSGAKVEGEISAESEQHLLKLLDKQHLTPVKIQLVNQNSITINRFQKVSLADLEFLTSELSLLLESGVKIDKALNIIQRTKAKPALAQLLSQIYQKLKQGENLSQAISKFPDVFDPLYVNLIELGESSGGLSDVFQELALDLKFKRELQSKIISALTYPLVIFMVCVLAIVFIFNFIIPKMSVMFQGVKDLPWYTELILSLSQWMQQYQMLLLVGVITTILLFFRASKISSFQLWWQKVILKLPIINQAVLTVERIRFNSALAMMLKSGIQVDRAIELATGSVKNNNLKQQLSIARKKIKSGSTITPALRQTAIYPDFLASLLEVGEESGNLARVFNEIASRSKTEFEAWVERITSLLEPLMILVMGAIVGGIVVVMLLSMVSINDIGI